MSHWAKAMRLFLLAAVKSQYWGAGEGAAEFQKSGVWWGLGVGSQSIKRDQEEGGRDVG